MSSISVHSIQKKGLSNVQQEILKLYSTGLDDNELYELKMQLAQFYAHKAIRKADEIWGEKGYSVDNMNNWLHNSHKT